jgi:hypothetical protein
MNQAALLAKEPFFLNVAYSTAFETIKKNNTIANAKVEKNMVGGKKKRRTTRKKRATNRK